MGDDPKPEEAEDAQQEPESDPFAEIRRRSKAMEEGYKHLFGK